MIARPAADFGLPAVTLPAPLQVANHGGIAVAEVTSSASSAIDPGSSTLPAKSPSAPEVGPGLMATSGSLVLVLVLIIGLGWLARRLQGFRVSGSALMRVLASHALGPRAQVVLLKAGDTELLLGVTATQINLLHRFETPLTLADSRTETAAVPGAFAERLRQFMQGQRST